MSRDHMLGYGPATQEDWSGLEVDRYACGWGEACMGEGPREVAPRRWIGLTCMTKADQDARQHDVQAGRLGLPMFRVEQPGTLVFYDPPVEVDMIQGLEAAALSAALKGLREAEQHAMFAAEVEAKQAEASAHARAMGEAHQQRMLKRQAEIQACIGMQPGDSGWRDWNDG